MIALAAICLVACAVEPSSTIEPTLSPTIEPTRVPTSEVTLGVMESMPCVEVMRYFDSIRLQRDDSGLSTEMKADNVELWIDFAILMSRLHGETVNVNVARGRVEECQ